MEEIFNAKMLSHTEVKRITLVIMCPFYFKQLSNMALHYSEKLDIYYSSLSFWYPKWYMLDHVVIQIEGCRILDETES